LDDVVVAVKAAGERVRRIFADRQSTAAVDLQKGLGYFACCQKSFGGKDDYAVTSTENSAASRILAKHIKTFEELAK